MQVTAYLFSGQVAYRLEPAGSPRQYSAAAWTGRGSAFALGSYERLQLLQAGPDSSLTVLQDLQVCPESLSGLDCACQD